MYRWRIFNAHASGHLLRATTDHTTDDAAMPECRRFWHTTCDIDAWLSAAVFCKLMSGKATGPAFHSLSLSLSLSSPPSVSWRTRLVSSCVLFTRIMVSSSYPVFYEALLYSPVCTCIPSLTTTYVWTRSFVQVDNQQTDRQTDIYR